MANWSLYKGYRCQFCPGAFVIIKSESKGGHISYLPINYNVGEIIPKFYDKETMRSHLLDCEGLAKQWFVIKGQLYYQSLKESWKNKF